MNSSKQNKKDIFDNFNRVSIEILSRREIDADQWDGCLAKSPNETPLANSWVLDLLSPGWEGLIINNYEGVMPLPVQKKMGYYNLQMPIEVLTLGIFSANADIVNLFPDIILNPVFKKFRFIQYNGSPSDSFTSQNTQCRQKQTFELSLAPSYNELYCAYSRNHRRSIRFFKESGLNITFTDFPKNFTLLIEEVGKDRPEIFMPPDYRSKFESMARLALKKQMGTTYSVWADGELIGAAFFLEGKKRIIPYHLANEKGRKFKTSFALIDKYIKDHAESDKVIDFAGSVIPNVASFNKRFGAIAVPYCSIKINRLPQPLKWAKEKNLLFKLKQTILRNPY